MQLGRAAEESLELRMRQERPELLQGTGPAQLVDGAALVPGQLQPGHRAIQIRSCRPATSRLRLPDAFNYELGPYLDGVPACLQRQLPRKIAGAGCAHRITLPVSRISRPSAKLDFPLPFLPTISVKPGPGATSSVVGGPIPRKPLTVSDARYAPTGDMLGSVPPASRRSRPPPSVADSASSLSRAASRRSEASRATGTVCRRCTTIPSSTSSMPMKYHKPVKTCRQSRRLSRWL